MSIACFISRRMAPASDLAWQRVRLKIEHIRKYTKSKCRGVYFVQTLHVFQASKRKHQTTTRHTLKQHENWGTHK
jgi:hypothetical protein